MQLARFGAVGLVATATHAGVFVSAIELGGMAAVPAAVLSFSVALMVSHLGHHRFTFRSSVAHRKSFPRFALVAGLGLGLNVGITYLVVDMLRLSYVISLVLVITTVPLLTFAASHLFVYGSAAE